MRRWQQAVLTMGAALMATSFGISALASSANAQTKVTANITLEAGIAPASGICGQRALTGTGINSSPFVVGSRIVIKSGGATVAIGRFTQVYEVPTQYEKFGEVWDGFQCVLTAKVKLPTKPFYEVIVDGESAGEFSRAEMKRLELSYE
jgi:hypothetical protein